MANFALVTTKTTYMFSAVSETCKQRVQKFTKNRRLSNIESTIKLWINMTKNSMWITNKCWTEVAMTFYIKFVLSSAAHNWKIKLWLLVNPFKPDEVICQWALSIITLAMPHCLKAWSHYPNHCWPIINTILRNISNCLVWENVHDSVNKNIFDFFHDRIFPWT